MPDAPVFQPADPGFEARVRASFARQTAMTTIGATMVRAEPGEVEVQLPWAAHLTQQHGFLHGGIIGAALDSACGYAGSTLMPAEVGVLSIEYKINFVAPARGQRFRMVGTVVKPGRTITVVEGRAFAVEDGREKLVATMSTTLMVVAGRDDVKH
ncbi:PaaI family thioesterase [Ramlibacter henchirensis]|uniref:Medium/long-chain acyl-CoA thioesterase YigI n=1 Tax=Ramlibacter henchirensis TaxID=204072 RepID=A0A4Z0C9P1_9BURK|nr:PaaI family thioesterase [Ramlibacter henchirensis]TFZ07120.1 PaaI family thioesterase [Ramlibacter henchirensis]